MASNSNEVVTDLSPLLRVYKDGTIERLTVSPHVPPMPDDPTTGVSSKDVTISPNVSARLYLPKLQPNSNQKLPILVYFHGGGFCIGSAFSLQEHRYLNLLSSQANALAVSVDYRLAPEHPLPAAYEDSWDALQWVVSHKSNTMVNKEEWLINHGDFDRVSLGGDSAGANIVHSMLLRAGRDGLKGETKILGAFLSHPYFCGSRPIKSEPIENHEQRLAYRIWMFVYPSAPGGIDNPMINPYGDASPSLAGLACSRLFVCVSEKDLIRDRGIMYADAMEESDWAGEMDVVDVKGENHVFQVLNPYTQNAKDLIQRLANFIGK